MDAAEVDVTTRVALHSRSRKLICNDEAATIRRERFPGISNCELHIKLVNGFRLFQRLLDDRMAAAEGRAHIL